MSTKEPDLLDLYIAARKEIERLNQELQAKVESTMTETDVLITQLQQQQALITQIVKAQLEGRWVGADSTEAFLYALDPNMQGTLTLDTPVTHSEAEQEPPKVE